MKRSLILPILLLVGCGGGNNNSSQDLSTASGIGPSGGKVTVADGSGVQIPSGALTAEVDITVTANTSAAAPSGVTLVGPVYTLGPEGQQFAQPVTVTLAITPSKIPSGKSAANVVIYTAPVGSTTYTMLTTTVVDSTHVSAQTSHFSNVAPGVTGGGSACGGNSDCMTGTLCIGGMCQ